MIGLFAVNHRGRYGEAQMSRRTEGHYGRLPQAAVLAMVLAGTWASPPPASAQLPPVGSLVVTVTSPASGSTVGGTIAVNANVSIIGLLTVQRVQFQLDGANLGAADDTAPYSVPWNTFPASNGSHTLRAIAQDMLGIWYPSDPVTVTVFNDHTPPTVAITSPGSGATVTGIITVSADASDNVGVTGVQFQLDGASLGAEDTTAPYSATWNTATASIGTHTLRAIAHDAVNNVATSASVTVTVPDTTPPTVGMTSPASGATVSGSVNVSANASDNVGVAGVRFQLDGAPLGAEDTTPPYSVAWDSSSAVPGSHSLRAVARDAANNTTTSAAVTVTVRDVLPPTVTLTAPSSGATVSGTTTVSASASDNVAVVGVQFRLDGAALGSEDTAAPYSASWNTVGATEGSHTLSAVARDAAGNSTISASVTVTVANDTVAPTVALTSPAAGSVSGTVTVAASASDNVGVTSVQFRLDGAALGADDTSAPYSVAWDTTTAADGSHTLSAIARDAAGNSTTAATVTVTVNNSSGPQPGDLFVTITDGSVQWRSPDGTLRQVLPFYSDGQASSAAFDAAGNMYVPHWWGHSQGMPGNLVVRYSATGAFLGPFGSGYSEDPSSITFDRDGNVFVGQADGAGHILKFDPAGNLMASFAVAVVNRGTDHIDLAADGCTMFYTSRGTDVLRYDVCTNTQLTKLNLQPLSGEAAYHVRALPDGGVLVADSWVVARLDAAGNLLHEYYAPGEPNYWGGVDIVGDGTFWATNAYSSNVYRFDLQSGAILSSFNTGTPIYTAAGLGVKPIKP
jgi:Big-like domain-containing protein